MLCDKCKKNEATVHIKEFHNGKCTNTHLCSECAGKEDAANVLPIGFNLAEVLMNVGKLNSKANEKTAAPSDLSVCPVCSWTLDDIRKHDGKFGCPACYGTFEELVKQAVSRVQRGSLHLGKRPKGSAADSPAVKRGELESLQKELKKLVAAEEYEAAAICRDRINLLKEQLNDIRSQEEKI